MENEIRLWSLRTHDKELSQMINLFARFMKITGEQAGREITIVLENNSIRSAIAVDSVVSVERLASNSIEPMPDFGNYVDSSLFSGIAKSSKDGSLVILIDAESVIDEARSAAAA